MRKADRAKAPAPRIDIDIAGASDALRSALIFLPDDGSITRFDGGFTMLTPSNPGYWWGNTLYLDHPPAEGDLEHWHALFTALVHARHPGSTHMTFGWDGDDSGAVAPFVDAGFDHATTVALAVDRGDPVAAPHPEGGGSIVPLDDADRSSLRRLLITTRLVDQQEADYADFIERQTQRWRSLEMNGQGRWFGVRSADGGDGIVAALGVFAERERGPDGRRIGRFQHVVTAPSMRRRGWAGRLIGHASAYAFDGLDVDTLLIMADEHGAPRRVYEACGFRFRSRHHGLERSG